MLRGLRWRSVSGGLDLALVEIDEGLAALARENAALNGIACDVVVLDVAAKAEAFSAAGLAPDSADRVLMNPPFNDAARHQPSPDQERRIAHEARSSTLDAWVHAARRLLKPGGALTLIWRAEGLSEVLAALGRGFGGIAILPVHPKSDAAAIRVLVKAEKGSGAPLTLLPGFVLNGDGGKPTPEAESGAERRGNFAVRPRIEPRPALLLRGFALAVGRSSEVNGCQEHADQQHQEIDLHCISNFRSAPLHP